MPSNKKLVWLVAALALVGFIDAVYLTAEHYLGGGLKCILFSGCDIVTTSAYAAWGPVPVALVGAIYYLALLVFALLFIDRGRAIWLRRLVILSAIGFLATLYFVGLQALVLKAFCFYCLVSAVTTTAIFLLASSIIEE